MELVEERVALGGRDLSILRPRDSEALLVEEAFEREELLPYWAELWPSSLALARAVHDATPRGRVVELGCGLGLPSLAAALAGAEALATDWSEEALRFAAANAERNGVDLQTLRVDWHRPASLLERAPFDLVLAADVLYEPRDVDQLLELLPRLASIALLADPGRPAAGRFLAHVPGREILTVEGRVTVYRLTLARGLEKRYGRKRALPAVDLDLARDELLLVTGPNGSGKTTLLRLCAGLALPSRGELQIDAQRAQVGYLGHESLLYRDLTALENLDLYGRLYRVPERRERIGMLLERFGLWDVRGDRVASFSRGMTQRLALCRALLHDPDLLVLDEPYTALDEEGASVLDRELTGLREGRALLVATHDPARIEPLATGRLALA